MAKENKIINDFKPLIASQKFTKPPSRLSDVSICTKLDQLGILRPSMANGQITKVLVARKYIEIKSGTITVTELGLRVCDFLIKSKFAFVETDYTAKMEENLDLIADGKKKRVEVLNDFYHELLSNIENAKKIQQNNQETDYICPKCGSHLLLKHSQWGPFYSCSNYKKPKKIKGKEVPQEGSCSYTATVGPDGQPVEKVKKVIEYASFKCEKCGGKMVKRKSSWGEFCGCEKYPACKSTASLDGVFKESTGKKKFKKYWKKKKE